MSFKTVTFIWTAWNGLIFHTTIA